MALATVIHLYGVLSGAMKKASEKKAHKQSSNKTASSDNSANITAANKVKLEVKKQIDSAQVEITKEGDYAVATTRDGEFPELIKLAKKLGTRKCRELRKQGFVIPYPHTLKEIKKSDGSKAYQYKMNWVEGKTFGEMTVKDFAHNDQERKQGKGIDRLIQATHQLVSKLHTLHKKGVLHRDIQPANIMLDENHQVRILDFGMATADLNKRGTVTERNTSHKGSPAYVDPGTVVKDGVYKYSPENDFSSLALSIIEIASGGMAARRFEESLDGGYQAKGSDSVYSTHKDDQAMIKQFLFDYRSSNPKMRNLVSILRQFIPDPVEGLARAKPNDVLIALEALMKSNKIAYEPRAERTKQDLQGYNKSLKIKQQKKNIAESKANVLATIKYLRYDMKAFKSKEQYKSSYDAIEKKLLEIVAKPIKSHDDYTEQLLDIADIHQAIKNKVKNVDFDAMPDLIKRKIKMDTQVNKLRADCAKLRKDYKLIYGQNGKEQAKLDKLRESIYKLAKVTYQGEISEKDFNRNLNRFKNYMELMQAQVDTKLAMSRAA